MDSSTSPSNRRFPSFAAVLLLAAIVSWLGCVFYTLRLNPEIKYYACSAAIQDRWAEKMTREHGAKVLIYGGSSCAFSINGEQMLDQFSLPTVNYGNGAGIGAAILTESVLGQIRRGDTLIVALEPELLTLPFDLPAMGVQFSFAVHHPEWVVHPVLPPAKMNWFQALAALRPGGDHTFTLLGKIVSHKPLMRYQEKDIRPSGLWQTAVQLKTAGAPGHGPRLSNDARTMLQALREWSGRHDVRVAYSLPWAYSPPERETLFRKQNGSFLMQVNEFIPVLKDTHLGACTNFENFADTAWHLNRAGSTLRTDELGQEIKNWNVWTEEELRRQESQP